MLRDNDTQALYFYLDGRMQIVAFQLRETLNACREILEDHRIACLEGKVTIQDLREHEIAGNQFMIIGSDWEHPAVRQARAIYESYCDNFMPLKAQQKQLLFDEQQGREQLHLMV